MAAGFFIIATRSGERIKGIPYRGNVDRRFAEAEVVAAIGRPGTRFAHGLTEAEAARAMREQVRRAQAAAW